MTLVHPESTVAAPPWSRRGLRAPSDDGGVLCDPPYGELARLANGNRRQAVADLPLGDRRLSQLRAAARADLLADAIQWTSAYRNPPAVDRHAAILLAGHQPTLFHPGVWAKNFALGRLARESQATAINLLIDSDTLKSPTIRVPGGTVEQPALHTVAFDEAAREIPLECRGVVDPAMWQSFARRAGQTLAPLVPEPLLTSFWPRVVQRWQATGLVGASLAQARHALEGAWGLSTLEVPQSRICQSPAFGWFAAWLLAELPRLTPHYNEALWEYRRAYRLRSVNHPVPELACDDDGWWEAPLWLYRDDAPLRRHAFVRRTGQTWQLTDRAGLVIDLPLPREGDLSAAAEVLAALPARGIRLRTRALLTTLWARLVLGDLFLHGLGGGKYDELTDRLFERWFAVSPPGFAVLTATLRLPVERPPFDMAAYRDVRHRLRELDYQPERSLPPGAALRPDERQQVDQLVAQKQVWLATPATRANRRARHHALVAINQQLQPWVAATRHALQAQYDAQAARYQAETVLGSRDYAFCLYPSQLLREFLLAIPAGRR